MPLLPNAAREIFPPSAPVRASRFFPVIDALETRVENVFDEDVVHNIPSVSYVQPPYRAHLEVCFQRIEDEENTDKPEPEPRERKALEAKRRRRQASRGQGGVFLPDYYCV